MVVQASSAAAKDIPAAMVIATGKPAAIRAGFSKAAPESPAARGRAATAAKAYLSQPANVTLGEITRPRFGGPALRS